MCNTFSLNKTLKTLSNQSMFYSILKRAQSTRELHPTVRARAHALQRVYWPSAPGAMSAVHKAAPSRSSYAIPVDVYNLLCTAHAYRSQAFSVTNAKCTSCLVKSTISKKCMIGCSPTTPTASSSNGNLTVKGDEC